MHTLQASIASSPVACQSISYCYYHLNVEKDTLQFDKIPTINCSLVVLNREQLI